MASRYKAHPRMSRLVDMVVALALSAMLLGCAVDARSLSLDPAGSAGSGSSGGRDGGAGGPGADPGDEPRAGATGGSGPPQPVELPVCIYEGEAIDPECATLAENAGFAKDIQAWESESGARGAWSEDDAMSSTDSGAIELHNFMQGVARGVASNGARQCISATPSQVYDVAADAFIPEGQGKGLDGEIFVSEVAVSVLFFSSPDCQGGSIGNFNSKSEKNPGKWLHLEGAGRAPEAAQSMAVRLTTVMPFRQLKFEALFDNVFVREREP